MLRKISIANRLRPFSHTPGTRCLIPGSTLVLRAYPTRVEIEDWAGKPKRLGVLSLSETGMVRDWTVQLDVDKAIVSVFGKSELGFFSLEFCGDGNLYSMKVDRAPEGGIEFSWEGESLQNGWCGGTLARKEEIASGAFEKRSSLAPRLSLGMHKKQLFPEVLRRGDLREIFPLWVALGCRLDGSSNLPKDVELSDLIRVGFSDLLVPKSEDDQYLGVELPKLVNASLDLLAVGAKQIVGMFLKENGKKISVLPEAKPEFACGRLIDLKMGKHLFELEWTKKRVRRMIIHAGSTESLDLQFPKGVREYRLTLMEKGAKGKKVLPGQPIQMEEGKSYFFDRFQH